MTEDPTPPLEEAPLPLPALFTDEVPPGHRSGFVGIVGKPNVGKSTLLNRLLGMKLAAVSAKASTTRHRILGILNGADYQLVFVDTPGVIKPKYALHNAMMRSVGDTLAAADAVVLLVAPREPFPEDELMRYMKGVTCPVVLVVNKADISSTEEIQKRIEEVSALVPPTEVLVISAAKGFNVEGLPSLLRRYLPEAPPYFPKDQVSDRPERFFVAEIIREKLFRQFREEVPYGAEVAVELFEEREDGLVNIQAVIHVERDSQKGILIGNKGEAMKKVGTHARHDIEDMLGQRVFLKLFVKVTKDWKRRAGPLRDFGYDDV